MKMAFGGALRAQFGLSGALRALARPSGALRAQKLHTFGKCVGMHVFQPGREHVHKRRPAWFAPPYLKKKVTVAVTFWLQPGRDGDKACQNPC